MRTTMQEMLKICEEAKLLERQRICKAFQDLAAQMDAKADEDKTEADDDETEAGLVWVAAAASIRRVCDEVS